MPPPSHSPRAIPSPTQLLRRRREELRRLVHLYFDDEGGLHRLSAAAPTDGSVPSDGSTIPAEVHSRVASPLCLDPYACSRYAMFPQSESLSPPNSGIKIISLRSHADPSSSPPSPTHPHPSLLPNYRDRHR